MKRTMKVVFSLALLLLPLASAVDFDFTYLVQQLDQKWPSLKQTNLEFWSHEWKKHGTCSKLTQYGYFEAALKLEKLTNNLTKILADRGVGPSDVNTYTFRKISDALNQGHRAHDLLQVQQEQGRRYAAVRGVSVRRPLRREAHQLHGVAV
uniref:Uncharacterized protein n=1 Tax=Oryza meridionalis TaxID=40149 RepID=A0A0E0EER9_9ORYZ